MSNPPLGIVPPLEYLLNDATRSLMSPPRGPMGGGAFIVALRDTVYVTPGPYLPIAIATVREYSRKILKNLLIDSRPCMRIAGRVPPWK